MDIVPVMAGSLELGTGSIFCPEMRTLPLFQKMKTGMGDGLNIAGQHGWNHIVATYDSTFTANSAKLYFNGELVSEDGYSPTSATSQINNLLIGAKSTNPGDGESFRGLMDEIRLYNRELTAAEVQELAGGSAEAGGLLAQIRTDRLAVDVGEEIHFEAAGYQTAERAALLWPHGQRPMAQPDLILAGLPMYFQNQVCIQFR